MARPLTEWTKKDTSWKWSPSCMEAFTSLKNTVTQGPILQTFDPGRHCFVEVDLSDWAHGSISSQFDNQNILHPLAFFSGRLNSAQINYEIYDKEL